MRSEYSFVYRHFFDLCSREILNKKFNLRDENTSVSKSELICDLLVAHPDYIAKQQGIELILDYVMNTNTFPKISGKLYSLELLSNAMQEADIDRETRVNNIYQYLHGRHPWQL